MVSSKVPRFDGAENVVYSGSSQYFPEYIRVNWERSPPQDPSIFPLLSLDLSRLQYLKAAIETCIPIFWWNSVDAPLTTTTLSVGRIYTIRLLVYIAGEGERNPTSFTF